MIDPNLLKNNLKEIARILKEKRNLDLDIAKITSLETDRKETQVALEDIQAKKNQSAKEVGIKKSKNEDVSKLLEEINLISQNQDELKSKLESIQQELESIYNLIPNIPADEVPVGKDENFNLEVSKYGTPKVFDFEVRDHITLGEMNHELDFETAANIAKSRFSILQGKTAKLHRALIQFMLDLHTEEHNYLETYVPYIVNGDALYGTGQLPKFKEDLFGIKPIDDKNAKDFYLIPTAEVPVTNMVANKILKDDELPLKFVAHTPCFRSEAGSYGRDTRGLIRMHQFEKVELVQIVKPEDSEEALEKLTSHAEKVLQLLELPYRKVMLCTGDLGFSSSKTYDLEVWIPAQNTYREISSCSNMRDFQARRMKARYKSSDMKKPALVHTLNGSGLAVGRTLVAIMENYQQADGRIKVPAVLKKYMNNIEYI
ncbi:MAG: serine--tRNA ligase [Psittacicella sp.]